MVTPASRSRTLVVALAIAVLSMAGAGCVAYPVAVVPAPADKYDRVWDSALRAADDVGIQVASAEKSSGYISGTKGPIQAQIFVLRQADGAVRVQLDLKGPLDQDPGLADRFSRTYDRYMGR